MKKNSKGFTLIELLAVIVIMGILMMVAIPAMSKVIENSRKDTFIETAQTYVNSVNTLWKSDSLYCGSTGYSPSSLQAGNYYILIDSTDTDLVERGGKSSWGNRDVKGYVRVNVEVDSKGNLSEKYYIALTDGIHGVKEIADVPEKLKRRDVLLDLKKDDPYFDKSYETTCGTDNNGTDKNPLKVIKYNQINKNEFKSLAKDVDEIVFSSDPIKPAGAKEMKSTPSIVYVKKGNQRITFYNPTLGYIAAPVDSSNLFEGSSPENPNGLKATKYVFDGLVTDIVTNANAMFKNSHASKLDFFELNFSKIKTARSMFEGCKNITRLNFEYDNNHVIEDTSYMFNGCTNLKNLYISFITIDKLKNVDQMYGGVTNLSAEVDSDEIINLFKNSKGCSPTNEFFVPCDE